MKIMAHGHKTNLKKHMTCNLTTHRTTNLAKMAGSYPLQLLLLLHWLLQALVI